MIPDRVAVLDWSAAGRPVRGGNSIWLALASAEGTAAWNDPTRNAAEARLVALIEQALDAGQGLLIGADFSFGYPAGFAAPLTGQAGAPGVWDWLAARIADGSDNRHNLRAVAARMNAGFAGQGPFWGNGAKAEVPGLPRTRPALPPGLAERRGCEAAARAAGLRPKSVWQLAGAGAVGAQSLMGQPMLSRLKARFGAAVAVWPFESHAAPIRVAEVYPSMLAAEVRALCAARPAMVPDEAQVRLLARALHSLSRRSGLAPLFAVEAVDGLFEEGWILGIGHVPALRAALKGQAEGTDFSPVSTRSPR